METNVENEQKSKKTRVLWLIIFIILLIVLSYILWKNTKTILLTTTTPATSPSVSTPSASISVKPEEKWTRSDKAVFDATSSDTHKLSDETYRIYLMQNGNIVYADSKDGANFQTPISTGIGEDSGKIISNPAVLETKPNEWIMIYEQQPTKKPGMPDSAPGSTNQRNLYLATSSDGKIFEKVGIAIDSSKEDNYFASVPDLILLSDGRIRMYYVSGGEAIGSAISNDNGQTWTKESGYRLTNKAVDPDVLIKNENGKSSWIMYYSVLTGADNRIYKSTSLDGLIWTPGVIVLEPKESTNNIVDPDVIEMDPNHYRMFFGEMTGDSTSGQSQPSLYYADYQGNIF